MEFDGTASRSDFLQVLGKARHLLRRDRMIVGVILDDATKDYIQDQGADRDRLHNALELAVRELDSPGSQCRYCSGTILRSAQNPERGYKPRFVDQDGKRSAVPFPHRPSCVFSIAAIALAGRLE